MGLQVHQDSAEALATLPTPSAFLATSCNILLQEHIRQISRFQRFTKSQEESRIKPGEPGPVNYPCAGYPLRVPFISSPIRTNLRMVELDFMNSKRLPSPCRSWRLEEIRLLTLASLPDSLLQREAPWSICWSVCALRGACGPRQRVWRTASPLTPALLSCSDQARALAARCSPGFP